MKRYLNRLLDTNIEFALKSKGCVVIKGPKWCGKSTTSKRFAKTVVELQKPSTLRAYKLYAAVGDAALLGGEKPKMFDEWQKIPDLWDYIRAEIDETQGRGLFILTGSVTLDNDDDDDNEHHSGIGRMKRLTMRPMSMYESQESTGQVSLSEVFNGSSVSGNDERSLAEIAYILCRGGWPQMVTESNPQIALSAIKDYVNDLVEVEINEVGQTKRNPTRARAILRAYARNVSSPSKLQTLQKDLQINQASMDPRTIDDYINVYKKLFILEDVEAWSPNLRSKAVLRTADTRQFVDPSIAAALLDANPNDLMYDLKTFGLLFESLCIRDLRIYAEQIGGKVFNYRDSSGLEIDAIVHLENGQWGAIEIKLGGNDAVDSAAANLLNLMRIVDTNQMNPPKFLMVLVSKGYAYKRSDGVLVVPVGTLKN